MTEVVVEVGPATIRGPEDARAEMVSAAVECIDDDLALLDDRPVAVPALWRDVMRSVVGQDADRIVLVCPTRWPAAWIDRARHAALSIAPDVVVLPRAALLGDDRHGAIVELAPQFVVVSRPGADVVVVPRRDGVAADVGAVVAAVDAAAEVTLDAPAGVEGGGLLRRAIADRLRARGIAVRFAGDDAVRRAAVACRRRTCDDDAPVRLSRHRRATAVLSGIASAVMLCGGFAMRSAAGADDPPMTLMVEGRLGVMVPAGWHVERITAGPGSARVQVVSPVDDDIMLHLTQSAVASSDLAMTAEALRAALDAEPDGLFVDFNPADRRVGRPVVTYREIRPQRQVSWAVVVDDTIRIAIGCQSAPGREQLVRDACERAIRSAHAIF